MELWLKCFPYDKELITFGLERGISSFWIPEGSEDEVKRLGRVTVISAAGDLRPGVDFEDCSVRSGADLERLYQLTDERIIFVDAKKSEIIPLENLIASGKRIFVPVREKSDIRVFSGVLEKGVSGVVLDVNSVDELVTLMSELPRRETRINIESGVVREVRILGLGDRVCVDTCSIMSGPLGMLVGNSSRGFFLVSAENVYSEYVSERPFRVNAGAVHMYTLLPSGKTSYLSEVDSGSRVMIVGPDGRGETAYVGRAKIERRPLVLIRGESSGVEISAILQNAETIRLIAPDGSQISVADIRKDMEIVCHIDDGGRHFGMKIDERIEEK